MQVKCGLITFFDGGPHTQQGVPAHTAAKRLKACTSCRKHGCEHDDEYQSDAYPNTKQSCM